MKRMICIALFLACFSFTGAVHSNDYLNAWDSFSKQDGGGKKLLAWLRTEAVRILKQRQAREGETRVLPVSDFPDVPSFYGSLGLFITFMEKTKNRGCYGSFYHSSADAKEVLSLYLTGALRNDTRGEPLFEEELEKVKIVLTVAEQPFQVSSLDSVDISKYGVLAGIADGGLVFVPAEIKTHERLRALCGNSKWDTLYAFKTVTINE